VEGDAQGRVNRQMALFLKCAPGVFGVARWFFQRAWVAEAGVLAIARLLPQVAGAAVSG
jgi:hypothetical protein